MDIQAMMNDEIRPKCPKCGGENFAAVMNRYVLRCAFEVPMIICAELHCQTVVGVLPIGTDFSYELPDA